MVDRPRVLFTTSPPLSPPLALQQSRPRCCSSLDVGCRRSPVSMREARTSAASGHCLSTSSSRRLPVPLSLATRIRPWLTSSNPPTVPRRTSTSIVPQCAHSIERRPLPTSVRRSDRRVPHQIDDHDGCRQSSALLDRQLSSPSCL